MAKPTQVQLNAAKQQFEASPGDGDNADEKSPVDMRADKPRVMKLAKAMTMKPTRPMKPMKNPELGGRVER